VNTLDWRFRESDPEELLTELREALASLLYGNLQKGLTC
jgi:hypothetical protein